LPIVDLDTDCLAQQCANCNAVRQFARPALDTGDVFEPTEDPFVLALPPCERCAAREFLIRSRGDDAPEPHSHQSLVDRLFRQLRRDGGETARDKSLRNPPALSLASSQGGT
jgi:hypothetical protein